MSFIEYLIEKGYTPYRRVWDKSNNVYRFENSGDVHYFSSCVPGYLDLRLIKQNCTEIIWGLHEYKHSPTLLWPKLGNTDAEVDRLFMQCSHDDIYKLITKNKED